MAMQIVEQTIPGSGPITEYSGSTVLNMNSGKSLKIETSPRGIEILDMQVPLGKQWKVLLKLHITETDL